MGMNINTGELACMDDLPPEMLKEFTRITGTQEIAEAIGIIEKAKETGESPVVDLNGESSLAAWARAEKVKLAKQKAKEKQQSTSHKRERKRVSESRRKNRK